MLKHRTRWLSVRRALALSAATFVMVGGAAACQPRSQILQSLPPASQNGRVAVTVTYEGKRIDALVSIMRTSPAGVHFGETGTDGKVTVAVPAGAWKVNASAQGAALPNDPMCWEHLENDPLANVHVAKGHTRHITIAIRPEGVLCA